MNTPDDPGHPPPAPQATATGVLPADLATGSLVAGRFRIEGVLGVGGMGVVYRARDEALGVPVAVKLLRSELADRPGAFERFRQELLLARQVSSPHVVRIHDIGQHEGRWLISMDLVDGEPLDRRLDLRGALPVDEALAITRQVALGLQAAHQRGIVHRDLKPSNVLLDVQGQAYVSDFGIARSLGTRGMTQTGAVVGTPDYLSPEQARAEPLDGRSDLYALGLLLYEMLAGKPAYSDGTASESLSQRLVGPPPPIRRVRPEVPAWVERLLDRLLRPQPSHRLPSAEAVIAAMDREDVPRDWRRLLAPGAAAALVLAAAFALWLGWPRAPTPVATMAPPDRLLMLPIANATGDPQLSAPLRAVGDILQWQRSSTRAVADGERISQALSQLGLPDADIARLEAADLRTEARGTLLVRARAARKASGYRLEATIERADTAPERIAAEGVDLLQAARALDHALARALGDPPPAAPGAWPNDFASLRAHGEALALRRAGRMEPATQRAQQAASASPEFAPAWLALSLSAMQSGQSALAAQAAARGAGLPAPPRLHAELLGAAALAGADAAPAMEAWQARLRQVPDDLDARLRLAQLQGQANELTPAIAGLRELLARDGNDPRAWYLLGKFSILRGDLRQAVEEHLVRALVLYKRGRNAFGEAETVNAMGVAYARLGQADDAAEQFGKAVALRRALGDRRGVASTLRNLAQQSLVQGRFAQAQAQMDEARGLFVALGDVEGEVAVDNELGLLAEERGDHASAEAAFRRVLRAREDGGDEFGVAESLDNLGFARYALGDYDSAGAFWRQSLDAFTRMQDTDGIVRTRQNLGMLELARGRWEAARELLDASLAVAERQQLVEEAAVSRYYLAELAHAQGRLGDALATLDGAQSLFASRKDRRGLVDVALLRARVLVDAGAYDAAKQALAQAGGDLGNEQRAAAALLRARFARQAGDGPAEATALAQARQAADASGMQAMKLRVAIASDPGDALDEATRELGHFGVRLDWLRAAMRRALARGDAGEAAKHYAQARSLLKGHESAVQAVELHALGARALAASDAAAAGHARQQATTARERQLAALPEAMRASFPTTDTSLANAD
jgi:tetratricopeptide (TPR) repeat protein